MILRFLYKKGELQLSEYENRINILLNKTDSLELEKKSMRKQRRVSTKKLDLIKYNFKTNSLIDKKEVVDNNGNFINLAYNDSYGIVDANKKGEIFLVGRKKMKKVLQKIMLLKWTEN